MHRPFVGAELDENRDQGIEIRHQTNPTTSRAFRCRKALLGKLVEIDFVRLTDYNKEVRIWYELPFE